MEKFENSFALLKLQRESYSFKILLFKEVWTEVLNGL